MACSGQRGAERGVIGLLISVAQKERTRFKGARPCLVCCEASEACVSPTKMHSSKADGGRSVLEILLWPATCPPPVGDTLAAGFLATRLRCICRV